jgi:hypothetical protein
MPHRGITFVDENNVKRYFAIVANNAEPEEGGTAPVLLVEYHSEVPLHKLIYNAEFKNKIIPVEIYVAANTSDDYLFHSLSFEYQQKKHHLQVSDGVQEIFIYGDLADVS